jgi:hypothetical protein
MGKVTAAWILFFSFLLSVCLIFSYYSLSSEVHYTIARSRSYNCAKPDLINFITKLRIYTLRLSLCLNKHYTKQPYASGSGVITTRCLKLCSQWRYVVSFKPCCFRQRTSGTRWIRGWKGHLNCLDAVERRLPCRQPNSCLSVFQPVA